MQDINYIYDSAKNIKGIVNGAGFINVDLGGRYYYEYKYDDLYRLTGAGGNFSSYQNGICPFEIGMEYSPSGNITQKTVSLKILINGVKTDLIYDNGYQYNDRPHTVTNAGNTEYSWDANGNMIRRENPDVGRIRLQCWDEENRLTTVHDCKGKPPLNLSSYLYNAGGERTWKLTGEIQTMWINGETAVNMAMYDKTLYSSPYMVMNEREYTKHYFIDGERVCSKLGSGFALVHDPTQTPVDPLEGDYKDIPIDLWEMVARGIECVEFNPENVKIEPDLPPAYNMENRTERDQFFYHSDHLGSSSFITNINGAAIQHLQYLPFGETYIDERASDGSYNTPYKFSGKEKDDETQYSYFGARYYDSDLSVWLSVDPMSDKYPSTSSYMYCLGNPIMLIDPFGLEPGDPKRIGFFQRIANAFSFKGYINRANKYAVENGIADYRIHKGKGKVTIDNTHGDSRIVHSNESTAFQVETTLIGETAYFSNKGDGFVAEVGWGATTEEYQRGLAQANTTANYTGAIASELIGGALTLYGSELVPVARMATNCSGRIVAESLKDFKSLVQRLSKPGSQLSKPELQEFEKLTEQFGGKLRYDLNPVKGKNIQPHVQVEGLGKSIEGRHIWLGE